MDLRCFKAYDIRGKVPQELDEELARRLGLALHAQLEPGEVVLGRDVRLSSPALQRALAEGPPLGHYEARWAEAEVASAVGDPRAGDLARTALALMHEGGLKLGRDRMESLAAVSESR